MLGSQKIERLGKKKNFIGKKGKAFDKGKKLKKGGAWGAVRRVKGKC